MDRSLGATSALMCFSYQSLCQLLGMPPGQSPIPGILHPHHQKVQGDDNIAGVMGVEFAMDHRTGPAAVDLHSGLFPLAKVDFGTDKGRYAL